MSNVKIQTSLLAILVFLTGCSDQSKVADISEAPKERNVASAIEEMFVLKDIDGDGVLESIQSPRNDFWTRELLSEPIARLGGTAVLEPLLKAYVKNTKEGHDNDGFSFHLVELVKREPRKSEKELKWLKENPYFKHNELCDWLLESIKAVDKKTIAQPIRYSAGDSFQGMWNYDRRNANLRMTIEHVDTATRILLISIQSDDLDNEKKEFIGKVKDDGRELALTGIARSGSDYEITSGYSVRDFLRRGSTMEINLNDFDSRKLRGEVENGTNIYFWSKSSRE